MKNQDDSPTLPCIVCREPLNNVLPDAIGDFNQPSNGLAFITYGHYGSTIFDPVLVNGQWLEINICDKCVLAATEDGIVLNGIPAPRSVPLKPTYRMWEASLHDMLRSARNDATVSDNDVQHD